MHANAIPYVQYLCMYVPCVHTYALYVGQIRSCGLNWLVQVLMVWKCLMCLQLIGTSQEAKHLISINYSFSQDCAFL